MNINMFLIDFNAYPTNFGFKHLTGLAWLFTLIATLLVVLLVIKKKFNKGENYDKAVIRYTCYFMWFWEIVKSIRMINCTDYGPVGYYPLWMAPFHICSMGLYAYLIIGAKKNSKLQEWVKPFGFSVMILVTNIILIIPQATALLGNHNNWNFTFDNILPYQTWLYHGCLVFVPLYMVLSGFYKPKWSDLYKSATVLVVVAAFAQAMNYILEGSNADFMTLRYGYGNPFAFLLQSSFPFSYYIVLAAITIGGSSLLISVVMLIQKLINVIKNKIKAKKTINSNVRKLVI